MKKTLLAFSVVFSMISPPAFAQQERPFSEEGGCTSAATSATSGRKSCGGDFKWPDRPEETPNTPWAIIPDSIKIEVLDERGTGSGCSHKIEYEEREVDLPDTGKITVGIPVRVVVSYNARGGRDTGERGRIECRVIGRYKSL